MLKRKNFLKAAQLFLILAIFATSLLCFGPCINYANAESDFNDDFNSTVLGSEWTIVDPVGLTGGIFSLRRRYIASPILGNILLLTSGVLLLVLYFTGALPQMFLWIYGVGAMILSILSIIFAAISKSEFT